MVEAFDEVGYLNKYPDVAEGVAKGAFPSGEWHFKHYGQAEKRTATVDLVTDKSPVWQALKKCARFHPNLENMSFFHELMERIQRRDNFHIARYNDGEWTFMLQIEPYYSMFIENHKHNKREVMNISEKLLKIVDSIPPYYIGIDSNTRALQGTIVPKKEQYLEKVKPLKTIVYGDVFNAATVRLGLNALLSPLKSRFTISVGPDYMAKLGMNVHMTVPSTNCWHYSDAIQNSLYSLIKHHLSKNPVIVYSCSLLAKLLIDVNYQQFTDKIAQLDVGSCIDPWCGFITRPWHIQLVKHYQLRAVSDGAYRA